MMSTAGIGKYVRSVFGSVFPKKTDLETQVERLYQVLGSIEERRALANSKGWKAVQRALLELIIENEQNIVVHCHNPVRYERELLYWRASRDAYLGLLGMLELDPDEGDKVMEALERRLEIMKAITGYPRPSDFEDNLDEIRPLSRI